jgi:cytochrome c oxidase cbb3-type subunit 3
LNTPLPRWWLIVFFATIIWAVGYWILMPAWPLANGYTHGLLDYSLRDDVAAKLQGLKNMRAGHEKVLSTASLEKIVANPDLQQFALAEGKAAFGDNCAPCHGAGGQGAHGYPNLTDDVWIWGGKLEDIQQTITVGVRSTSPDTRQSQMPAFGKDAILQPAQIDDLTQYVLHLRGQSADPAAVSRAGILFADNCAACHGADAKGNRSLGAPNLGLHAGWLYGAEPNNIHDQIWFGHGGVMPSWGGRLSPETIKSLAIYVHSLGGGE